MKNRLICALLAAIIILLAGATLSAEKPLLYVSGDPDCYPLEYYDTEKKAYAGYLPALIARFGEEYGYGIVYLSPTRDTRKSDLENSQVDFISAATASDFTAEQLENGVTVYLGDEEVKLLFTEATGEKLRAEFSAFLNTLSEKEKSDLFLASMKNVKRGLPAYVFILIGSAFLILAAALAWAMILLHRRRPPKESERTTDILTGLNNYWYVSEYFRHVISDGNRALYSAVYFNGRFKNDRGDQNALLRAMAEALRTEVSEEDVLARIDDGFLLLLRRFGKGDAVNFAQATVEKLSNSLGAMRQFASAHITAGVCSLSARDRDIDRIIANAVYCSRYARHRGEQLSVFSAEVEQAEREEEQLAIDLHSAFDNEEFAVYLQFFVDDEAKHILGAEALSRWNHPTLGLLSPSQYIELVEKENLFEQHDLAVLKKTCDVLEEITKTGDSSFFLACNFSRSTMVLPDFISRVEEILNGYTFPRDRLYFEVTEYARTLDNEALANSIRAIKALGIKVIIDDFGSGFSDLGDLGKMQFDAVKLDRSLVAGVNTEADDRILASIVSLMHELGMTVIAEGIEEEVQADRLRAAGCHIYQGYLYYMPMPRREALRILASIQ